jgi:hypothetical protein
MPERDALAWRLQRADPDGPILYRHLLRKRYAIMAERLLMEVPSEPAALRDRSL